MGWGRRYEQYTEAILLHRQPAGYDRPGPGAADLP